MRKLLFPIILGLGGIAILLSLCVWQIGRLAEKEAALAEIEAKIAGETYTGSFDGDRDALRYSPVSLVGGFTGDRLFVLTSLQDVGAGYRIIEAFDMEDDQRVLVDRGFVRQGEEAQLGGFGGTITGNLHWPDEADNWTPAPDGALWFARDVDAMAEVLDAQPVLVISNGDFGDEADVLTPTPIDTSGIPNNHLNYAITWALLALVWAIMTLLLIKRTRTSEGKG